MLSEVYNTVIHHFHNHLVLMQLLSLIPTICFTHSHPSSTLVTSNLLSIVQSLYGVPWGLSGLSIQLLVLDQVLDSGQVIISWSQDLGIMAWVRPCAESGVCLISSLSLPLYTSPPHLCKLSLLKKKKRSLHIYKSVFIYLLICFFFHHYGLVDFYFIQGTIIYNSPWVF